MEEKIFFENGKVRVTNARFVAGSKTFAMANVSSVSIGTLSSTKIPSFILFIIGVILLIPEESRYVGGALSIVGVVWYYLLKKDEFAVRITSNSGQEDGYISQDKIEVEKIVAAVNEAIIYRG